MPIYIWKCEKCDTIVEELRKMGDNELPSERDCEETNELCEFKKQMTAANFRIDPAAG